MKSALIAFIFSTAVAYAPGGPGPHHIGPQHGPPPPYLRNVTDEARREYFKIMSNGNLTIAEQKKEVEDWAKTNKIEEEVQEFDEQRKAHMEEVKKNVTKLIGSLPTALEDFSKVMENEDQTRKQREQKKRELSDTNPKAFHVLEFAFHEFMPRPHGPHVPHGPPDRRHRGPRGDEARSPSASRESEDDSRRGRDSQEEQKKKIEDWAKEYKIEKEVVEFDEKIKAHMKNVKTNVTKLTDYQPTALGKFSEIMVSENQTYGELWEKRKDLTAQYPGVGRARDSDDRLRSFKWRYKRY
ncbi:hypothetical protein COOONC_22893 [Cooperia oncophora]